MNKLDFVFIFSYKTRYYTVENFSNNFEKNFIESLNYLRHGLIHSGYLQTFWSSFNIIAYTTNAEVFYKKPYQAFLGLNLKAEDYRYLTKLKNTSS